MRTTPEGIELIKEFEGLKLEAYLCPAGKLSIGYGSTRDVQPGLIITQDDAEMRLIHDIAEAEQLMLACVRAPLTDNQISALTSFVFNVGIGRPGESGRDGFRWLKNGQPSTLLKFLNAMNFVDAVGEFDKWCKVKGETSEGLRRRRLAERELFMRPDGKAKGWMSDVA